MIFCVVEVDTLLSVVAIQITGMPCSCSTLLLLHQGAEAGLGDEAPHRVQLQWTVTSQPWCGPASPRHRPPVEADIGVDSEGGTVGRQFWCLPGDLIVYYLWS